ncbi:nucleoside 2-deoxyribosyltransferase [Caballeronia sp. M23-90]
MYLACFDVFRIDAVDHGAYLKDLCRKAGYVGMYPFDNEAPSNLGPADKAAWICRAKIDAIRSADMVMANLNDFRGLGEPDSGTAFEVGLRPRWESLYGRIDPTLDRLWNRSLKRPMRSPLFQCAHLGTSLKILA